MKKLTTFAKSCSKLMLLMVAVALSAFTVKAADPVDLGALELGKLYSFSQYQSVKATFTAPADGTLKMDGGSDLTWYTDAAYTKEFRGKYDNEWTTDPDCSGQIYYYTVTKGTTYYLYARFPMNGQGFKLYMEGQVVEPFRAQRVSPSPNSTFTLTQYKQIQVTFNKEPKQNGRPLLAMDDGQGGYKQLGAPNYTTQGKSLNYTNIDVILRNKIADGTIRPGEKFYLITQYPTSGDQSMEWEESKGILKINYQNRECLAIPFVCPSIPVNFASKHVPAKFLSYWTPGNPDAIVSVTFTDEVALAPRDPNVPQSGSYFSIGYGDLEAEGPNYYYFEDVPKLSEDKKTVYYDLSGVRRTAADMLPLAATQSYPSVTLSLCGIVDTYGNPVGTESEGKVGSFGWGVPFEEVSKANFSAEFTPASGADLSAVNEIEVYFGSLTGVTFDGFKLTYKENGEEKSVVVALNECKFVKEGDGGAYTFAIPESIKALGNVAIEVTLANLVTNDGFDHTQEVRAAYNTFVLTYSNPVNGWESKSIPEDFNFEFLTNWTDTYPELYLEYQIRDMNPDEPEEAIVKTAYELTKDDTGMWKAVMPRELVLYQGREYRIEVNAWKSVWDMRGQQEPAAMAYVVINGQTQPYVNSTNVLLSITPDPEAADFKPLTADDNVITLEFDGPVYLEKATTFINEGMGMTADFESITPVNGDIQETGNGNILCSNIWKLTIAKSYLEAQTAPITISFVAYDVQNKVLEGNNGKRENSFWSYEYSVAKQWAEFEIALESASEEPTSVVAFRASSESGIGYNFDETQHGKAQVYDKTRNLVATVTEVIDPNTGSDDYNVSTKYLILKLDKEITTAGSYILMIPEGFFNIGEQHSARYSAAKNFIFDVYDNGGGDEPEFRVEATPADGSNVKELSGMITLTFVTYSGANLASGRATISYNGTTETLPEAVWGTAENQIDQPLGKTYTAEGTYVITFPAGCFSLGDLGDPNPEFTLTYIIGGNVSAAIVAVDGKYRVYNLNGVLVLDTENVADLDNLAAGIYVINGSKVVIRK